MAPGNNRFQAFFEADAYVLLKNALYNYRLRKRAIERVLRDAPIERVLEAGSGLSPIITRMAPVVYTDLSPLALRTLRTTTGQGAYIAADATCLPFRDGAFSHAVASEVLEHIEDDEAALLELARVLEPGGEVVITFPHRRAYFANDDRFVHHERRYELEEMEEGVRRTGLEPVAVKKVLGPLEKLTMMAALAVVSRITPLASDLPRKHSRPPRYVSGMLRAIVPVFAGANRAYACLAWLDARLVPRAWAAVLLLRAKKP